jgi:hypothetical protein
MSIQKKRLNKYVKHVLINNAGHPHELEAVHLIESGIIRDIPELMQDDDIRVIQ